MPQQDKLRLISELEQLYATIPTAFEIGTQRENANEWYAITRAVLTNLRLPSIDAKYDSLVKICRIRQMADAPIDDDPQIRIKWSELRAKLKIGLTTAKYENSDHGSAVITAGARFDYFDEIRKKIELATQEILIVDPYLNSDFISRYMPFVNAGVTARLITGNKQIALQAAAAAKVFADQHGTVIEIRRSPERLHDRWLIVDQLQCYQSGASFAEGANKSNTTITEVIDLAPQLIAYYEDIWQRSNPG